MLLELFGLLDGCCLAAVYLLGFGVVLRLVFVCCLFVVIYGCYIVIWFVDCGWVLVIDCCFLGCGFVWFGFWICLFTLCFDVSIRLVVGLFSVCALWFVCGLMVVMLLDTINSVVIYYV